MMRLLPKQQPFFQLFQRAAQNVLEGAIALRDLITCYDRLEERWKQLTGIENRGDDITHEIANSLNKTFVTPIDREDIHSLATGLDDVIDYVEATADRLMLYGVQTPTQDCKGLAEIIVQAAQEICHGVHCLSNLKNAEAILLHCREINRLENIGDTLYREGLSRLFDGTISALDVMKWKDIYDHLETATDKCEDVADTLEAIVVKNA